MNNLRTRPVFLISPVSPWRWTAPPLGISYIASSLEAIGCKVKLVDCQVTPDYKKKIISSLADYPAVGISVNAGNVSSALDIARAIRQHSPQTRIIMGGPHATAIYDILIPEYADIVVRGEGEDTVTELFQTDDLTKVKGIAYWDGQLKVNPPRPYIEDLDRLRFPAWHLYDLKKYEYASCSIPFVFLSTSRGCPYDCIYCTKFVHGYKVRIRSIDNILSEIDYLIKNFKIREINISDDTFTFYPQRVKELCRAIIEYGYNKKVRFSGTNGIRPDICDPDMFKLLHQAGFYKLFFSVESGSQEVLDNLGRGYSIDTARKTIETAVRTGFETHAFFTMGFPFDSPDSIQKTINFAKSLPINNASFAIAIPLAGTKFHQMVKEAGGKFLFDLATTSVGFDRGAAYESDSLSHKELEKLHRRAYRQFYLRPLQIFNAFNPRRMTSLKTLLGRFSYGWNILFRGGQT